MRWFYNCCNYEKYVDDVTVDSSLPPAPAIRTATLGDAKELEDAIKINALNDSYTITAPIFSERIPLKLPLAKSTDNDGDALAPDPGAGLQGAGVHSEQDITSTGMALGLPLQGATSVTTKAPTPAASVPGSAPPGDWVSAQVPTPSPTMSTSAAPSVSQSADASSVNVAQPTMSLPASMFNSEGTKAFKSEATDPFKSEATIPYRSEGTTINLFESEVEPRQKTPRVTSVKFSPSTIGRMGKNDESEKTTASSPSKETNAPAVRAATAPAARFSASPSVRISEANTPKGSSVKASAAFLNKSSQPKSPKPLRKGQVVSNALAASVTGLRTKDHSKMVDQLDPETKKGFVWAANFFREKIDVDPQRDADVVPREKATFLWLFLIAAQLEASGKSNVVGTVITYFMSNAAGDPALATKQAKAAVPKVHFLAKHYMKPALEYLLSGDSLPAKQVLDEFHYDCKFAIGDKPPFSQDRVTYLLECLPVYDWEKALDWAESDKTGYNKATKELLDEFDICRKGGDSFKRKMTEIEARMTHEQAT